MPANNLEKNPSPEILPLTIRQIALSLLGITVLLLLLGYGLYQRKQQQALNYTSLAIPKIIRHKLSSSAPDSAFESMSFAIPPSFTQPSN